MRRVGADACGRQNAGRRAAAPHLRSARGWRLVERILTVVQTLRPQRRQVWHFVFDWRIRRAPHTYRLAIPCCAAWGDVGPGNLVLCFCQSGATGEVRHARRQARVTSDTIQSEATPTKKLCIKG